jgi:glycosyltransferase involved in cell wall biosynthesis
MVRIGIDGRPFQTELAGTGRYVLELCRVLDFCFPEAEFYVYSNRPVVLPVQSDRWRLVGDPSSLCSGLPASVWYLERVGLLAKRDAINVFWGTGNLLPRGLKHGKSILTVYDLVPQLFPATMGLKHRLAYQLYFPQSLKRADRLVTISQGSRYRLAQAFGRLADEVVYPCAAQQFSRPSALEIDRIRLRYELRRPFLLAVATLEPRKNIDSLIKALISLKRKDKLALPDLALVGQVGWKAKSLLTLIEQAKSAGVHIVQTGFVPDQDLPGLYGACSAFVFPSLYEGFGMPVLEALRCGAFVLASDVAEIREAGALDATYFEPSVRGIETALEQFLQSEAHLKPSSHELVLERQHGSDWQLEGKKMAGVIQSLL